MVPRPRCLSVVVAAAAASWLAVTLPGCSTDEPPHPPLLTTGPGEGSQACAPGNGCPPGEYCLAHPLDGGCPVLACGDAGAWVCLPEGGLELDAGPRRDAGSPPSDAARE